MTHTKRGEWPLTISGARRLKHSKSLATRVERSEAAYTLRSGTVSTLCNNRGRGLRLPPYRTKKDKDQWAKFRKQFWKHSESAGQCIITG